MAPHQVYKHTTGGIPLISENGILGVSSHVLEKPLTSRRYSVHCRAELPLPLLRQAGLAESLKMCLHGGVHGQEIALKEAAESSGGHFSYLQKRGKNEL